MGTKGHRVTAAVIGIAVSFQLGRVWSDLVTLAAVMGNATAAAAVGGWPADYELPLVLIVFGSLSVYLLPRVASVSFLGAALILF
jgi:hypothetical protein